MKIVKYIGLSLWLLWGIVGISKNLNHYSLLDWIIVVTVLSLPFIISFILSKKSNFVHNIIDLEYENKSFYLESQTLESYKEDGVEQYQILAALDNTTCNKCGNLDGKIFPVSKAKLGRNFPPFHNGCRCTTVAYYPDTPTEGITRVARDPETGKTYEVPTDMYYKEWKKTYMTKK